MKTAVLFTVNAQQARPHVHQKKFKSFVLKLTKKGYTVLSENDCINGVPFSFIVESEKDDVLEIEKVVISIYEKYEKDGMPILNRSKDKGYREDI